MLAEADQSGNQQEQLRKIDLASNPAKQQNKITFLIVFLFAFLHLKLQRIVESQAPSTLDRHSAGAVDASPPPGVTIADCWLLTRFLSLRIADLRDSTVPTNQSCRSINDIAVTGYAKPKHAHPYGEDEGIR